MKKIILAKKYGFCFGVRRAIDIAEKTSQELGPGQAFVWKEIVHNEYVVSDLRNKGIISVKDIKEIPRDKTVICSAHGVAPEMEKKARELGLNIVDATCPIVASVHKLAKQASDRGDTVIYVGDKGHDEEQGVKGEVKTEFVTLSSLSDLRNLSVKDPTKVTVLTQTTLAVEETKELLEAIKEKFPQAKVNANICRATTERQQAVKDLVKKASLIIVVGSPKSANSKRLKEVAEKEGADAILVNNPDELKPELLKNHQKIGITAGASTPEWVLKEVIEKVKGFNPQDPRVGI